MLRNMVLVRHAVSEVSYCSSGNGKDDLVPVVLGAGYGGS